MRIGKYMQKATQTVMHTVIWTVNQHGARGSHQHDTGLGLLERALGYYDGWRGFCGTADLRVAGGCLAAQVHVPAETISVAVRVTI